RAPVGATPQPCNVSRRPPQARPPAWPAPPAPAIAALCSTVQPLIEPVPPERWMPPPKASLGPLMLGAGLLLLWFPLPPTAWLWSNVLALTTNDAGFLGPPLRMAPPTPVPGRIALELSLPPIAWLWLNVLLVTVRLPLLLMTPPAPVAARLPVQKLPARATL